MLARRLVDCIARRSPTAYEAPEDSLPATPVSLRLDDDTRACLVAEAARVGWLDAQDALRRQIDAAVEEADGGVFVSFKAVGAWMASWDTGWPAGTPSARAPCRSRTST